MDAEMANDMSNKPDTSGTHIWLRYTTQFTSGKRTHTVEVGIPVPIGASVETRERLIREAEVGMEQLAGHMERRVEQMQHSQAAPPQASAAGAPRMVSTPASSSRPPAALPPAPALAPAETPPPAAEQREVTMPPTRPNIGASMPIGPGDVSSLPQFLQYINRELGLDARKAMELLGVKSLQGLNYRDVAEQLQLLVLKEGAPAPPPDSQLARDASPAGTTRPAAKSSPAPAPSAGGPAALRLPSRPAPASPSPDAPPEPADAEPRVPAGVIEIKEAVVRGYPAAYGFDEEEDLLPDDDAGYLSDLSEDERERAGDILTKLREAHGSSQASEARLKVLSTVVNNQVSDDQLEDLIAGVWGTTALKKLKNDQLEALIYWAKHADDFIAEVDMILTLLQEESYARSDR